MIAPWASEVNFVKLIYTKETANSAQVVLILAHGAGAPADSPFMEALACALEQEGIACVRFEFPYMQKRRDDGRKRPPDRQPKLLDCFSEVVDQVKGELGPDIRLLVGGKSMGGRMASILAADKPGIDGVVCFGYPFHPPGKLDRWRIEHFSSIPVPMLVLQGTRDPFGKPDEVRERVSELGGVSVQWLEGGNHDYSAPVRLKRSQQDLIDEAASETMRFVQQAIIGRTD